MRRPRHILLRTATLLSLLLTVALTGLWIRGRHLHEYVAYTRAGHSPVIANYPNGIFLAWNRNTRTEDGFTYLAYEYGDLPTRNARQFAGFAYRNDRYPPTAPGGPT